MDRENPTEHRESDPKSADLRAGQSGGQTEANRVEVSAATVTRMMGIASTTDIKLLESRIDLLGAKLSQISTKIERLSTQLNNIPTSSDIDRLEIHLGGIKSMLREIEEAVVSRDADAAEKGQASEQSKKLRQGIRTNSDENE